MSGIPQVLAFGGTDSSGGSGLSADQRAVRDGGGYLFGIVTAVTAQGPAGVASVIPISAEGVRDQAEAILKEGLRPDAIKCGMLVNAAVVSTVADIIAEYSLSNLVLDPVILSTSGRCLLDGEGIKMLKQRLLPLTTLVTPNIPEAEWLTGVQIRKEDDMHQVISILMKHGVQAVLLKGGHATGDEVMDILYDGTGFQRYLHRRLPGNPRGTGCTLASAVSVRLAGGMEMATAVFQSLDYMQQVISTAADIGGVTVLT
ncbi:MAG: bifunctional hydroxymethylpyrimidine kinase/phosphomethylpyrimidine kinase [bacterium]|nr:bifunctional hydroxymethylpyrimidine kinase/phosphomethylpyrimidine kinase [bacterium]MDD3804964.1 bifunctional hydroxymethylpyrimidine kinase/phosphomethylpyrimidine kinase [bacterium]MDD4152345.1 bifunctional hydroxymethylpyrimidine kinase/phosphomethylpyrimidine kinase [bacterium]MDD4557958.1 bifunctional hydroxymethylpyrimidine kinase/phosphomethylpyrimidine kinase [bacterium]